MLNVLSLCRPIRCCISPCEAVCGTTGWGNTKEAIQSGKPSYLSDNPVPTWRISWSTTQWRIQAEAREARATPSKKKKKKKKGKKKLVDLVHDELKKVPHEDTDVEVDRCFKRAN